MIKNLKIFKTPEELADQFADELMNWVKDHEEDKYNIALSGGKTPDKLFLTLATHYKDSMLWKKVQFWWVDERMVPPNDPDSNFGVVFQLLFSKVNIPHDNIHRIKGENDPENECNSYINQIKKELICRSGWPVFDLIILGIGEDGHTASIFPDQMQLLVSDQICEIALHPLSSQKRITLTGNVINNAENVCFIITGINKAKCVFDIFSEKNQATLLPAAHIHPAKGNLIWYLDDTAAKYIQLS